MWVEKTVYSTRISSFIMFSLLALHSPAAHPIKDVGQLAGVQQPTRKLLGARTVDSEGLRADFRPWQHMMAEYDWIKALT